MMKIIHIMRDGAVRDSVEGLVVSAEKNPTLYKIINEINKGVIKSEERIKVSS